jgi:hypothetical protein
MTLLEVQNLIESPRYVKPKCEALLQFTSTVDLRLGQPPIASEREFHLVPIVESCRGWDHCWNWNSLESTYPIQEILDLAAFHFQLGRIINILAAAPSTGPEIPAARFNSEFRGINYLEQLSFGIVLSLPPDTDPNSITGNAIGYEDYQTLNSAD